MVGPFNNGWTHHKLGLFVPVWTNVISREVKSKKSEYFRIVMAMRAVRKLSNLLHAALTQEPTAPPANELTYTYPKIETDCYVSHSIFYRIMLGPLSQCKGAIGEIKIIFLSRSQKSELKKSGLELSGERIVDENRLAKTIEKEDVDDTTLNKSLAEMNAERQGQNEVDEDVYEEIENCCFMCNIKFGSFDCEPAMCLACYENYTQLCSGYKFSEYKS